MNRVYAQRIDSLTGYFPRKPEKVDTSSFINISGTKVIYELSVNPGTFLGNEAPKTTQQIILQPVLSIGGLKFNTSIQLNTDDLLHGRQLNRINFKLDVNQFEKVMTKFTQREKADRYSKMLDSTITETKKIERKLNQLNEISLNPDYQQQLEKSRNIIARAAQDSMYKKANQAKILEAEKVLSQDSLIQIDQSQYKKAIEVAQKQIQTYKLLKDMYDQTGVPAGLDPKSRIVPLATGGFGRFFSSPKRLELMDFSPNWSPLVLWGVSMRGGLIEFNQNNFILGLCGGLTNSQSWNQNAFNKSNKVFAIRGGWGNLTGNNLMVQYLNYQPATKSNEVKQRAQNVIGVVGNIAITPNHKINGEVSWSSIPSSQQVSDPSQIIQTIPNKLGNAAFATNYTGRFTKIKLNIDARFRMDGKYYYSSGSPSNRQDCYRYSLSAKKSLIKNKLSISAGYKQDGDHISGPTQNSVQVSTWQTGFGLSLRKVTLRFDYQQTKTNSKYWGSTLALVKLYNGSISFPYKVLGLFTTGTAYGNYMQLSIKGDSSSSSNANFGYSQLTRLKGGMAIQIAFSGNIASGSDSLSGFKAEVGLNKTFQHYQIGINYAYQELVQLEKRNILTMEMGSSLGKRIQVQGNVSYYNCNGIHFKRNNFWGGQLRIILTI